MAQELGVSLETLKNHEIAEDVRLFPVDPHSDDYPGDTDILGMISYFRHRGPAIITICPWNAYNFALFCCFYLPLTGIDRHENH